MKKITLFLVILSMSFGTAWAQKKIKLNLEMGKIYSQNHKITMDMSSEVMGMHIPIKMDFTQKLALKPIQLEPQKGVYTFEVTFEQIKSDMQVNGTAMLMDSDGDTKANHLNLIYAGLVHKPFQIKIQDNGKVLEVTGIDEIFDEVFDKADVPDMVKDQLKLSLKKSINKEAMSTSFSLGGAVLS